MCSSGTLVRPAETHETSAIQFFLGDIHVGAGSSRCCAHRPWVNWSDRNIWGVTALRWIPPLFFAKVGVAGSNPVVRSETRRSEILFEVR